MENGMTVRDARPEDAAKLLAVYAPYVLDTAVSFEYKVPSVSEFAERVLAKKPVRSSSSDAVIRRKCDGGVMIRIKR